MADGGAGGWPGYLQNTSFIPPLLGGEQLIQLLTTGKGIPWEASAALILLGAPMFFAPAMWKWRGQDHDDHSSSPARDMRDGFLTTDLSEVVRHHSAYDDAIAYLDNIRRISLEKISIQDAVMYVINRRWPLDTDRLEDGQANDALNALQALREAANRNEIGIWGIEHNGQLPIRIPPDFWVMNQIEFLSAVMSPDLEKIHTEPATYKPTNREYKALKIVKAEVEAIWPPAASNAPVDVPPPEAARRVPIRDLLESAEADGWEFKGSKNVLYYFGKALRQAAADGAVEIQGRFSKRGNFAHTLAGVLEPISVSYFRNHVIAHDGLHGAWMRGGVNHQTRVCDILEKEETEYVDLHVLRPEAWGWLHGDARIARDAAMTEENARRTALQSAESVRPAPKTMDFSIPAIVERGRRDNLHIRTQEALERSKLETAKAADFEAWDRKESLSLRTAAFLWAGERPADKDEDMSQMTKIVLGELVSAANSDRLKATPPSYPQWVPAVAKVVADIGGFELGKHDLHSIATREDLRAYALAKGEHPLFLFPEHR